MTPDCFTLSAAEILATGARQFVTWAPQERETINRLLLASDRAQIAADMKPRAKREPGLWQIEPEAED